MSKTQPFGADRCPNCGEYGPHFVPPSLGELGFFICEKKPKDVEIDRIKEIISLMKEEAEETAGKSQLDRVGRLHNVMLKVNTQVGLIMEKWRGEEALEKVEKDESK